MRAILKLATLSLLASLFAANLAAQPDPVVSKQEQAKRAFAKLTDRMQKLQVTLAATDPDKARLLGYANKYIEVKGINKKMTDIKELLQKENWDDALENCRKVIKDLDKLIEILLKGDSRIEELLKEMERLEAFKKRVEKLIGEQGKEKDDSSRSEALAKHLKDIEKAKAKIEDLIQEQKDIRKQANSKAFSASAKDNKDMAGQEGQLKSKTEGLAKDLKGLEKDAKDLAAGGAGGKPGEGKPNEGKPGGGAGGQGAPSQSSSSSAAKAAAGSMGNAQNKLQDQQPEGSLEHMDKAIDKLEAAKKDLEDMAEDARRRLQSLPFEQLAKTQEQTRIDTDRLAQDMEKSEQPGDDSGQGSKPTPGKDNVQQAVPKQKSAAGQLKEHKPGKAKQDQQDAKDDLEEAKRKLDEALAQLRQELQDEVLRSLEERFGSMLAKQKTITTKTKQADRLRKQELTADGGLSSNLKDRCNKLATGEFELAADASGALKLLEEEGTTAVFPDLVAELRDDLKRVGRKLQLFQTGISTNSAQKEVEETLKMLIEALRQAIEDNDQQGEP
jgi:chromosome segregation ATPase